MVAMEINTQCRVNIHHYHMTQLFLDLFITQLITEVLHRLVHVVLSPVTPQIK